MLFRHVSSSGHQMESSISIQYFAVETPAYRRYGSHSYRGRLSREQMDLTLCTFSVTTLLIKALTSGQLVYFISIYKYEQHQQTIYRRQLQCRFLVLHCPAAQRTHYSDLGTTVLFSCNNIHGILQIVLI